MIFSRCTLLFQTDVSERSKKYKEQTMPFSSYLQLSDRLQIVSMLIMISEAGFCFVKEKKHLAHFSECFRICYFKGTITNSILVVSCFLFANTGILKHIIRYFNSTSPHNDININVYGNELFFFFWRGTLSHIWFINVMNARNDQIICSCVLDMQWGALDWLKFKIGMPKLY